jgi:hypothetical protein
MIHQGAQFKQARLFNPVGMHTGNPWKLHPDTWVEDESRGPVVWHSTDSETLPGTNRPESSPNYAGDRQSNYGSAHGLHFGTQQAALDRAGQTDARLAHVARIPHGLLEDRFGSRIETRTDDAANYADDADDLVDLGHAVPYRNNTEDPGSTSYRVLPESVRTWGEDVMADRHAHPALTHLARHGYNPAVDIKAEQERKQAEKWGMTDQGEQGTLWDYEVNAAGPRGSGPPQPVGFHSEHHEAVARMREFNISQQSVPITERRDASVAATGAINRNVSTQQMAISNHGKLPMRPNLVKTGRREGR